MDFGDCDAGGSPAGVGVEKLADGGASLPPCVAAMQGRLLWDAAGRYYDRMPESLKQKRLQLVHDGVSASRSWPQ